MPMNYSVDDVAGAVSLQFFAYIYVSIAALWTYDYACSFHEEWRFLLVSHWTKTKGLYIVTRYVPFLLLAINLYLSFIPMESPNKCRILDNFCSGFGILSIACSEGFFALRTFALWNNNRILLTAILTTFIPVVDILARLLSGHPSALPSPLLLPQHVHALTRTLAFHYYSTILFIFTDATSVIPGITGCYMSSTSFRLFIPFLFLSVFELTLMILTLIRAIQYWRIKSGSLYSVLLKHNIFYYICGFLFSVANLFTMLLLRYAYHAILQDLQFVILAILATRMHRHLWQMKHDSDALMRVPEPEALPTESPQ
ncbi:hypothetical protein BDR07DRAFT_1612417 [Suillus spraguei]|nr:hypothetical protein BDR07DRAFT_1612417 [Suillus spraguei]